MGLLDGAWHRVIVSFGAFEGGTRAVAIVDAKTAVQYERESSMDLREWYGGSQAGDRTLVGVNAEGKGGYPIRTIFLGAHFANQHGAQQPLSMFSRLDGDIEDFCVWDHALPFVAHSSVS